MTKIKVKSHTREVNGEGYKVKSHTREVDNKKSINPINSLANYMAYTGKNNNPDGLQVMARNVLNKVKSKL